MNAPALGRDVAPLGRSLGATGFARAAPRKKSRSAVRRIVTRLIDHLDKEPLAGRLWVVDEHRIRIHGVSETI
jgi:hypothetical protein